MGQTTIIVMILTIVSKIFGFVRESVMAAFIGAGELKSIYTTSLTVPSVIIGFVSVGIVSAYIPAFNKAKNEKDENYANDFTSNLINILMIYGLISVLIIFVFSKSISRIFSPNLNGANLVLASNFTRILTLSIFTSLYSSVIKGYLNIKRNFIDPVLTGIILNIVIIISTLLTGKFTNPYILVFGTLIANVVQLARYPSQSKKYGFSYSTKIDFNDPMIRYVMYLIVPIILSSAANQISVLIDNSMASAYFGVSSVSKIYYSRTMLGFITGVITTSVSTVIFPEIAKLGQNEEIDKMKKSVSSAVVLSMILIIPATFGMMGLANPIIKLAFERNAFTSNDTYIVSSLLVAYAPNIIFGSLITIITNAFYSVGDTKKPVIIMLIQQLINIVLNILLAKIMGLNGLAIATSISTVIGSIIIMIIYYNKFGKFDVRENLKSMFKILIGSIIMAILARRTYSFAIVRLPLIVSLGFAVVLAGLVYFLILGLSRVPEVDILIKSLKEKIKR